jgi:hypothetical protein
MGHQAGVVGGLGDQRLQLVGDGADLGQGLALEAIVLHRLRIAQGLLHGAEAVAHPLCALD